jgi:putative hydrolase of the HAD superfamily
VRIDPSIKNLIFDLGGVLLDLSVDSTLQSFAEVSGIEPTRIKQLFVNSAGFDAYEKGEFTDSEFRDFVRKLYSIDASDEVLDTCWNAMLVNIPLEKLQLLETLKKTHNVFLLSNTSNIHVNYINDILIKRVTQNSLDDFFHHSFYSYRMKMRKPDAEIFQQVLDEAKLIPNETLFLDDNQANVEGASKLGINTVHVVNPNMILDYFS